MFLADTNVVSELTRRSPHHNALAWIDLQTTLAVSVVTLEELTFGVGRKPNAVIEEAIHRIMRDYEVVPVDASIARRSGQLRAALAMRGRNRTQADMLIAATALERGYTLATRNVRDFEGCGIRLVNPFS